jgi:exopolyphosphatase / guanosine-5'-triphosphate,3'-diphosphate pyrophosphatase
LKNQPPTSSLAIIDMGSNAIRLNIYAGLTRVPQCLYEEKAFCRLGAKLGTEKRLCQVGKETAKSALLRFFQIIKSMKVAESVVLATEVFREAEDGLQFIKELEGFIKAPITLLPWEHEATIAAHGVISAFPEASGITADYGGGSLEMTHLDKDHVQEMISLPIGSLTLKSRVGNDHADARKFVLEHLENIPWLKSLKKKKLYLTGGAWRSLGALHRKQTSYPLPLIYGYSPDPDEFCDYLRHLQNLPLKQLERLPHRKNKEELQMAALALETLIQFVNPRQVFFSTYGLREGYIYQALPKSEKEKLPFLSICHQREQRTPIVEGHPKALLQWFMPLFPDLTDWEQMQLYCACLLSEIAWETPDEYRVEQAFLTVVGMSLMGLSHHEHIFLAYTLSNRYGDHLYREYKEIVEYFLTPSQKERAERLGLALRLGMVVSGNCPEILKQTSLRQSDEGIVLKLPKDFFYDPLILPTELSILGEAFGGFGKIEEEQPQKTEVPYF